MTTAWTSTGKSMEFVTERNVGETDKSLRARHFADVAVAMDDDPPDHDHEITTTWN